jgi:hypothetical protein
LHLNDLLFSVRRLLFTPSSLKKRCHSQLTFPSSRNFPQGSVGDMVADVSTGIEWVLLNIGEFGGDPERVYVVGQSAGAHLSALAILRQAIKEAELDERSANGPKHVRFQEVVPTK